MGPKLVTVKDQQNNFTRIALQKVNQEQCVIGFDVLKECPKIIEWKCQSLQYVSHKETPTPFRYIVNVHFHVLKILSFFGDNIETIQSLSRVHAPQLQQLALGGNRITNITPLSKIKANLKVIDISDNFITQCSDLAPSYALRCLIIEYTYSRKQIDWVGPFIKHKFDESQQVLITCCSLNRLVSKALMVGFMKKVNQIKLRTKIRIFHQNI